MVQRYRSKWLTLLDHTNLLITALTGSTIILTRSAGIAYFAAGAVACSFTVKILKLSIRQPRPLNQVARQKATYGMPSTHSATISYYATYISLACLYLPLHDSFPPVTGFRLVIPLLFLPCAGTVVGSRIWLGHHTWTQVVAGMTYGIVFAFAWFKIWDAKLHIYGPQLERLANNYLIT